MRIAPFALAIFVLIFGVWLLAAALTAAMVYGLMNDPRDPLSFSDALFVGIPWILATPVVLAVLYFTYKRGRAS